MHLGDLSGWQRTAWGRHHPPSSVPPPAIVIIIADARSLNGAVRRSRLPLWENQSSFLLPPTPLRLRYLQIIMRITSLPPARIDVAPGRNHSLAPPNPRNTPRSVVRYLRRYGVRTNNAQHPQLKVYIQQRSPGFAHITSSHSTFCPTHIITFTMLSRSQQATSSVLKARPLQSAVAHDARRTIASKAESSNAYVVL